MRPPPLRGGKRVPSPPDMTQQVEKANTSAVTTWENTQIHRK